LTSSDSGLLSAFSPLTGLPALVRVAGGTRTELVQSRRAGPGERDRAVRARGRRSIQGSSKPTERTAASIVAPWLIRRWERSRRRVCCQRRGVSPVARLKGRVRGRSLTPWPTPGRAGAARNRRTSAVRPAPCTRYRRAARGLSEQGLTIRLHRGEGPPRPAFWTPARADRPARARCHASGTAAATPGRPGASRRPASHPRDSAGPPIWAETRSCLVPVRF